MVEDFTHDRLALLITDGLDIAGGDPRIAALMLIDGAIGMRAGCPGKLPDRRERLLAYVEHRAGQVGEGA